MNHRDTRLDHLISQAAEDSGEIMPLMARFIEVIASSNIEVIRHYQSKVVAILKQWESLPLIPALIHFANGVSEFFLTHYNEAEEDLEKALNGLGSNPPPEIEGLIRMAMGGNYRSLGIIDLAVENLLTSIDLIDREGTFKIYHGYTHYQLGEIHVSIGEFEQAKAYYEKALSIISPTGETSGNFRVNDGLGVCYMHLNDYERSRQYLQCALDIPDISGAERGRGLCDLGILYLQQGNNSKALEYLEQSYNIRAEEGLEDASSTSLIHMGEALINTGRLKEAIEDLEEAVEITDRFNAFGKKIQALQLLAKAHATLGLNEVAVKYFAEYDELNQKFRSEQERRIFRLKNHQIQKQREQLKDKNDLLIQTLDELARVKVNRTSVLYSIGTIIILVILTEVFIDPVIDEYAYDNYISLAIKVVIALSLKPLESLYESMLLRRAIRLKELREPETGFRPGPI